MSASGIAVFVDRAVVSVTGADAETFLQGIVTNDLAPLQAERAMFAGLLSPQGKVLFDFLLLKTSGGYWIDIAKSVADDLTKRLVMYKLRAKVDIALLSDHLVYAVWPRADFDVYVNGIAKQAKDAKLHAYIDPRNVLLGGRWITRGAAKQGERKSFKDAARLSLIDYDAHRISLGVPEGGKDYLFGELFPHEAMFDQLNGVSFTKGCYVGQEIVARMQHRGTARSRFLMVAAAGPLPERGTEVLAGDKPIGQMGSSVGPSGLALIRLDRLGDAYNESKPITVGGVAVTLAKPPFATFQVPEPQS